MYAFLIRPVLLYPSPLLFGIGVGVFSCLVNTLYLLTRMGPILLQVLSVLTMSECALYVAPAN